MFLPDDPLSPVPGGFGQGTRSPITPSSKDERIVLILVAIILLIAGVGLGGIGYYDISIWNSAPSHWWGNLAFGIGVTLILAGFAVLAWAFRHSFDSGRRGI